MGFDRKAYFNVLKVFDICLELPSNSEKYLSLVVDEFSELVHTRKLRCLRHLKLLVARPGQSETHRIPPLWKNWKIVYSTKRLKDQFGFVVGEHSEL